MEVQHPANLAGCSVHRADQTKRMTLAAFVGLLYIVAFQWSWTTMGEPYANAVEQARIITDTYAKEVAAKPKKVEWVEDADEVDDIDDIDADTVGIRDAEDAAADEDEEGSQEGQQDGTNTTMEAKLKKALPSEFLPSAGAASMLFLVITGHALFHLLCFWNVGFRTMFLFSPATAVKAGVHVLVKTLPHHGKPDVCKLTPSAITGKLTLVFQRRQYAYVPEGTETGTREELVGPAGNGAIVAVVPSLCDPVKTYSMKGLSDADAKKLFQIYGENRLSIRTPTLFEMWRSQLIMPVPMFQFFCSVLWMLDEYWQYTIMTFFTIMLLEAGTAFQRLKTLGQLTKMSMKPYPVLAYRGGKWLDLSTQELQPGDLISLTVSKGKDADPSGNIVPADCLVLHGSAVVNEASLTGESVPAMKDRVDSAGDAGNEKLEIDGKHRIHTLFSGTTLVDVKQDGGQEAVRGIPEPTNKGCVCYVLRTGFASSQGSLMQMIEFSTEGVAGDTKETFMALLLLLVCAIIAAVYVFKKGVQKGDKTTHELLIKSVLIITSVVPRQLPMQMALAVNTALMALMKAGVMCTEPFRVPLAGKITHALFDKTGTLTTDTLIPDSIVNNDCSKVHESKPIAEASDLCSIVLAGCHSLVAVGDDPNNIVGDPIETAALRGVDWRYDAVKQTARRGNLAAREKALNDTKKELKAYVEGTKKHKELTARVATLEADAKKAEEKAKNDTLSLHIKHRYHFSSQLQRMSVIAEIQGFKGSESKHCCLTKGSPESVMKLLGKGEKPDWYEDVFTDLMEQGMRVLALAYRWVPDKQVGSARTEVEGDLKFAGFISFSCRIRNDTRAVIGSLSEADHCVSMITGDGPLTALHVAKKVGICAKDESFVLEARDGKVEWVGAIGKNKARHEVALGKAMEEFAGKYNLMTTEENLDRAVETLGEDFWGVTTHIRVFARMSPPGKARVIRSLQQRQKAYVLMCGDGSNDVGALKQADVGLALLSGYGNANTGKEGEDTPAGGSSEDALNSMQKELDEKAKKVTAVRKELMGQKQKELQKRQAELLQEELKKREERGEDVGVWGQIAATKAVMQRIHTEMKAEEREVSKVGDMYGSGNLEEMLSAADDSGFMVRPGDASVAASFTSRMPTIKSCVDLIRQGRCTLLSALQQQQIMMLESIIHAYTLSALSLEGARQSERQMMASGWLITIATLAFSYATPIDKMHPQRPLRSLFHPAVFFSMVGQAVIHVYCLQRAVTMSTESMGEDELAAVVEFQRRAKAAEVVEEVNPDDPFGAFSEIMATWSVPFKPNLLNTVVFLVETAQIVAVLFVNYKGRPWMKGVTENHALFLSLFTTFGAVAYVAWGFSPEVNAMFHFASFPDDDFRWETIGLVALSVLGTLLWDRLATAIFAPQIFKIMLSEGMSTTFADILPIFTTLFKVAAGFTALSLVNPLILMGAYYFYRNSKKTKLGD